MVYWQQKKGGCAVKILFINLPYHGHVIPTGGLVLALQAAGHTGAVRITEAYMNQKGVSA